MKADGKNLAETVADDILSMITVDQIFHPGDKLPNENEFSSRLQVSRTTLREAIRILAAQGIVEIRRGVGTYVKNSSRLDGGEDWKELAAQQPVVRDLFEMRLIFEPQAAWYASKRATEQELGRILHYGRREEELILQKQDRTEAEQAFHKAIAKATHNEFMNRLVPILYRAIGSGVVLSVHNSKIVENTLHDHRVVMEFLEKRDADGAKTAMRLHILHAMRDFGFEGEN